MPVNESKPPITSKKAKRAYQQSGQRFAYSASQFRAAERRSELEERAQKLRDKEQRAKDNKRKRDEKEEKERESKRRLLAEGKVKEDDLLPKIRASQPRLNSFFRRPAPPPDSPQPMRQVIEGPREPDSQEDTLVNEMAKVVYSPEKLGDEDFLHFFSTAPSLKTEPPAKQAQLEGKADAAHEMLTQQIPPSRDDEQALLDAQLSLPESGWDFDIAEDESAENLPQPLAATSSPLKRKAGEMEYATPSKSARSALSEMSPSKVNIRAQEKPDTTSAPSSACRLPSPEKDRQSSSQLAQHTLAMISTQDLADDDDEFAGNKENSDPWRADDKSKTAAPDSVVVKTQRINLTDINKSVSHQRRPLIDYDEFGDCDDLFDGMDAEDEFDDGLDDDAFAGLSPQMPARNTAVSLFGSPKKVRAGPTIIRGSMGNPNTDLMPPPPTISKFSDKLREASISVPQPELPLSTQSFSFDADMEAEMLDMAEHVEAIGEIPAFSSKRARLLPWDRRSVTHTSQSSQDPLTSDLEELGD